jgi:hypothetical protein
MKQIIRLTESDLHRIVRESIQKILREDGEAGAIGDANGSGIESSVTPGSSSDSEDRNGQVLKGSGVVRRKGFMDDALDHNNMIKKGFEGQ